jgi:hypothetical protein
MSILSILTHAPSLEQIYMDDCHMVIPATPPPTPATRSTTAASQPPPRPISVPARQHILSTAIDNTFHPVLTEKKATITLEGYTGFTLSLGDAKDDMEVWRSFRSAKRLDAMMQRELKDGSGVLKILREGIEKLMRRT